MDLPSFREDLISQLPALCLLPNLSYRHRTPKEADDARGGHETHRPDVVLFVNGIPLVVIECKRPDLKDPIGQAVSKQIRNRTHMVSLE